MAKAQILVRLKEGVLDPQGKTIEHALHALDFNGVHHVRVGKLIEMELDEDCGHDALESMCQKLLANTVIEDYEIVKG